MTKVLQAKDIEKTFAKNIKVLQKVSIALHENEAVAVMGASGEGKTTLLHILGMLESYDKGSLKINNNNPSFSQINQNIGFVFQTINLLEDLSLIDNILMPASIARKNISQNSLSYKRAEKLIKEIGLETRKNLIAKKLSGGEKQRAAIARAFCNDPKIIIADEPSGNLDYANSNMVHKLLVDFVKKHNKSLIVATHDQELAKLCDKIYLLKDGKLSLQSF